MIRSAYALFMEERPDDQGVVTAAASDHRVPDSLRTRRATSRLYLSVATQEVLGSIAPDGAVVKLGFEFCGGECMVAAVIGLAKDDFCWKPPDVPLSLVNHLYTTEGELVRTSLRGEALRGINTEDELVQAIGDRVVLGDDGGSCLAVGADGGVVLYRKYGATVIRHTTIVEPVESGSRLDESFSSLQSRRVGIVGLGSLGSKVAVSLARTGVGSFVLVDGDVLHGGNLQRHDADWRDVGLHKTDVVSRRLQLVGLRTACESWRTAIGAQVSSSEAGNVDAALDRCDLIVDATAQPEAFNHLASLVTSGRSTLVWGAVYAGGVGGEVGRSRPRKDPSPFDIRNVIGQVGSNEESGGQTSATTGRRYDGVDDGGVVAAMDADVSAVANLVTSLALDALVEREPSRYDAHAYLVGCARGWIFEGPFHVQPIVAEASVRKDAYQGDDESTETRFLGGLIQARFHEAEGRSQDS